MPSKFPFSALCRFVLATMLMVLLAAPVAAQSQLSAWGYNGNGGLGDGSFLDRLLPAGAPGLPDAVEIAGGGDFSIAIRSDGTVWAWGSGGSGQMGNGGTMDEPAPVAVSGLTGIVGIAAGFAHGLAVASDGSVWAWGRNDYGELGDGSGLTQTTPVSVTGLPVDVVRVGCGRSHSFAITAGGDLWAWGNNANGQLGDGTTTSRDTPVLISGVPAFLVVDGGEHYGLGHTVALAADGTVWTWGANDGGQLGDGTLVDRSTPGAISLPGPAVHVAAGLYHGLAVLADGTVAAWGGNLYGELGDGTNASTSSPVLVRSEDGLGILGDVVAVSAGVHSLALLSDGTLRAWGYNYYGEVGDGTSIDRNLPVVVGCVSGVVRIAAADYHSMSLGTNTCAAVSERLSCWGYNGNGGLGDGSGFDQSQPVHTADLTNVQAIVGGTNFSFAIRADGTLWSWGMNTSGQLGDGTTADAFVPVLVPGLSNVVDVAAGFAHAVALLADGTVWSWGDNGSGQLGDGTLTSRLTPGPVVGLPADIVSVASGRSFSFALTSGGNLWAWGLNSTGQLGDGTTIDQPAPILITTVPELTDIDGGERFNMGHAIALAADGSVWTWGNNDLGQLGDGSLVDRPIPAVVAGLGPATGIAAGLDFCLALLNDGTVAAWGGNDYGQLGDGTTTSSATPLLVRSEDGLGNLGGITAVSAGVHALALRADGTIRAWGYNFYGELGDGTSVNRTLPVATGCLTGVARIAAADYHSMALGNNTCAPVSGVPETITAPGIVRLTGLRWLGTPGAEIAFELDQPARTSIDVYNVAGQRVARIADDQWGAGRHRVLWDGRAGNGARPATGIYFVRLATERGRDSRRLFVR